MRTTIRIDDQIYQRVKQIANSSGRTVGDVIEDAIRRVLADQPSSPQPQPEPLPTYGGAGVMPGVDLRSNGALLELMEQDSALDARR